jgi:aminoglycoside phosphotransferase family enzyme/predicted kinase
MQRWKRNEDLTVQLGEIPIDIALMNMRAYPEPTNEVQLVQTHISFVFITDNFVYKVKKPVNFGFLDFSTLDKRKYYCEKEVELNKRLSPDVYLGVLPVTLDNDSVTIGGKGPTIDYAVKMRKLPMENLMIRLLQENRLSDDMVENVARKIAIFHKDAARSKEIDNFGTTEVIRTNTDENFIQTEKYVGTTITKPQFDAIRSFTTDYLNNRKELFRRRIAEGRIRDCHGDLHLEHICITDSITIFDCIEFNDRFRFSDTAADIAFLAMDLDLHGREAQSKKLMDAYVRYSGDRGALEMLNFYKVYRAYVRGKVTSFRLDSPADTTQTEKDEVVRIAKKYFGLAASYVNEQNYPMFPEAKPKLIITCGLPGTGKSTVAENLAETKRWAIVSSDAVRKELAGIPVSQHEYVPFGKGVYSSDFTKKTYRRMNQIAEDLLRKGKSVILDACFGKRAERGETYALAKAMKAEFTCIETVCDEDQIKRRLTARMDEKRAISDARWEIFPQQKSAFEKVDEFEKKEHMVVDTSTTKAESMRKVMDCIRTLNAKQPEVATSPK